MIYTQREVKFTPLVIGGHQTEKKIPYKQSSVNIKTLSNHCGSCNYNKHHQSQTKANIFHYYVDYYYENVTVYVSLHTFACQVCDFLTTIINNPKSVCCLLLFTTECQFFRVEWSDIQSNCLRGCVEWKWKVYFQQCYPLKLFLQSRCFINVIKQLFKVLLFIVPLGACGS